MAVGETTDESASAAGLDGGVLFLSALPELDGFALIVATAGALAAILPLEALLIAAFPVANATSCGALGSKTSVTTFRSFLKKKDMKPPPPELVFNLSSASSFAYTANILHTHSIAPQSGSKSRDIFTHMYTHTYIYIYVPKPFSPLPADPPPGPPRSLYRDDKRGSKRWECQPPRSFHRDITQSIGRFDHGRERGMTSV
jgi:hypothetical protein